MAVLRNNHILAFDEVLETLLTCSNSCYAILLTLLTLGCTWLTIPKARTTPTNSYCNAHVGLRVIEIHVCEGYTVNMYT